MRIRIAGSAVTIPPVSPFWMSSHDMPRALPEMTAATSAPKIRGMWPDDLSAFLVSDEARLTATDRELVQTAAQSRLPAIRTGIILSSEPLFAAMFGFLLAGDRLLVLQWGGAGMIVVAIFVAELLPAWRRRRAEEAERARR